MFVRWTKIPALLIASGLAGCSMLPDVGKVLPDRRVEYKNERQAEEDLEIPPDLTSDSIEAGQTSPGAAPSGVATYSDYASEQQKKRVLAAPAVLPRIENATMKRDGDQRWLVVQAPAADVWQKILAFWRENRIPLREKNPAVGVMRTGWIERRAEIRSATSGPAYAAATRDQYRVRLEEGDRPGVTEVYLTHRSMEERLVKERSGDEHLAWVIRPTDRGLEAEMLRRMMVFFGVSGQHAHARPAASGGAHAPRAELLQEEGAVELRIAERFARAWRIAGMALDRGGFAVEDRDRGKGIYYVRYNDPMRDGKKEQSFFSKLAFWSDDDEIDKEQQYQVRLRERGEHTVITVQDKDGERSNSETARRILGLLHEQMK